MTKRLAVAGKGGHRKNYPGRLINSLITGKVPGESHPRR